MNKEVFEFDSVDEMLKFVFEFFEDIKRLGGVLENKTLKVSYNEETRSIVEKMKIYYSLMKLRR